MPISLAVVFKDGGILKMMDDAPKPPTDQSAADLPFSTAEPEPALKSDPESGLESGPEPTEPALHEQAFLRQRGTWQGRAQAWYRQVSRLPVALMTASLLLALGIVQLTFQIGNSVYRSVTWTQEAQATQKRVRILQSEVQILEDAQRSASDPAYLQQLARCQGYVYKNENVLVALNAPANPGYNCQTVRLP